MRSSNYDFNGWGKGPGMGPKPWEPLPPAVPYGAVPGEDRPQDTPPQPFATPDLWERRRRSRPRREKSGLPGFALVLVLLLAAAGGILWTQGGPACPETPLDRLWDWVDTWYWEGPYAYEEDWTAQMADIDLPRAPLGGDAVLTLTGAEGEALSPQEIYDRVSPSIVGIRVRTEEGTYGGTGVIFTSDGYILTNAHVIAGAKRADVAFSDGDQREAQLVGFHEPSDLAVLKIDGKDLPAATFGDSSRLRVGDPAYAIGNPLGEELWGTMTDGIISAIDRDMETGWGDMTLLQTTAAINLGSSGGALVDQYGQVVGVTNMKMMSYEATVEGLGFAIPTAEAKKVVDQLISQGYYSENSPLAQKKWASQKRTPKTRYGENGMNTGFGELPSP